VVVLRLHHAVADTQAPATLRQNATPRVQRLLEPLVERDGADRAAVHRGEDLDVVHHARIDDFLSGKPTLRAADPENRRTFEAYYNEQSIDQVLKEFRKGRGEFVAALEALDSADFARVSRHPRLDMPMRLVDMIAFVGDHDDYHLARIAELIRLWNGSPHARESRKSRS
jgi:hypothetical protein